MSGAFTVIFTLNLQYFSWGCSGSLSISKQKWAKFSSRNQGLDEIRGGQALLSITARRTPWPCQLRKDLILRDAGRGLDLPHPSHIQPHCRFHAWHPVPLPSGRLRDLYKSISYFLLEQHQRALLVRRSGTAQGQWPWHWGGRLPGRTQEQIQSGDGQAMALPGRQRLCRASHGFGKAPLSPLVLGLKVSPGDEQPPPSQH